MQQLTVLDQQVIFLLACQVDLFVPDQLNTEFLSYPAEASLEAYRSGEHIGHQ